MKLMLLLFYDTSFLYTLSVLLLILMCHTNKINLRAVALFYIRTRERGGECYMSVKIGLSH